ncbi:hypothetical protein [Amantichitinum ursilacus]|uniref:hypothetical protein n=1 Tax=Amantichitinum ursilacus TaxID=857265 RepID=UPI0006B59FB1|nr:hypothetical protein [Amantichitinum ursilacus]
MNAAYLSAEIVPGKSGAGFHLGATFFELEDIFCTAKRWNLSDGQIQEVVVRESGWLLKPSLSSADPAITTDGTYYYQQGILRVHFTAGILDWLEVSDGYMGKLFENIRVGDPLAKVREHFEIEYDDVEELHFPTSDSGVSGVAFRAALQSLESFSEQLIEGIFIIPDE